MNRGRFVTGEKLKEYRDYCRGQAMLFGGAVVTFGVAVGASISSGVAHVDLFGLSALCFASSFGLFKLYEGDFEKIERVIDEAGIGGENQ